MVKITDEMRSIKQSELQRLEEQTDDRIRRAVERGDNKAVFPLDRTDSLFTALRELYEANGYKIVPVGVMGGVLQRDYYITW